MTTFRPVGLLGPWDPGLGWSWWAGQGGAVGQLSVLPERPRQGTG